MTLLTRPVWKYRSVRIIVYLIAFWLLLAAVTALALPNYIRHLAVQQITEQTGRKATIDQVRFNLFNLSVYVHDFTLYDTDGTTPQFSAKELIASASISSLFHLAPVLDRITLTDPQLHIVRFDDKGSGTYNFSDILSRFKKDGSEPPAADKPFYFSVADVSISNGRALLEDKVTGKSIDIQKLNLQLPSLSTFPSKNPVTIAPSLSADINGTPFNIKAEQPLHTGTLPSKASVHIDHLDVTQYLPFIPAKLPVNIVKGEVSTDVQLVFSPSEDVPSLVISGVIQLDNVDIQDAAHQPLLKTRQAQAILSNLDVLKLSGEITQLTVDQPEIWATMAKSGQINWVSAFTSDKKDDKKTETDFLLKQLNVNNGTVYWQDQAFARPTLKAALNQIQISASQIATHKTAPAGSFMISANENQHGNLQLQGTVQPTTLALDSQLQFNNIQLQSYMPYVTPYLNAQIAGQLSASAALQMQDGILKISRLDSTIAQFRLQPQAGGSITADALSISDGNIDLQQHQASIGKVHLAQINAQIIKDPQGRFNVVPDQPAGERTRQTKKETGSPWKVTLNQFAVEQSTIRYTDKSNAKAQPLELKNLSLDVQHISSTLDQAMQLQIHTTINQSGALTLRGQTAPNLSKADMDINLKGLPVTPFQSFMPDNIKIAVVSGQISTQGKLIVNRVLEHEHRRIEYRGNASLNRFNVLDDTTHIPFLRFNELHLNSINTRFAPKERPFISVDKVSLNRFYARAVLTEKGQLNLRQLIATDPPETAAQKDDKNAVHTAQTAAAPAADNSDSNAPVIHVGDVTLNQGQINFTDNFVKPNYHVNLTGLTGTIGAVDSTRPNPAPVDLHAKIDNDSPVLISGAINPLFKPLFLDVKATATGVELPQLTPYSSKYAGYPIEKGKLSVEVNYQIKDEHLVASNNLKIDQLTFGDRVDSPDATSLPVMLAVSLLKDRNGVIDLNIPISGSLSDPQFSLGGVILRAFVNLIIKAATSPFTLISAMFGSDQQLDHLQFTSGSSELTPDLIKKMDTLNYALSERPGLSIDITGKSDINTDKAGIVNAQLTRQMQMMKWQDNGKKGPPNEVKLTAQDEEKYLTVLYKKASFKKPTNFIGLTKSVPVDEMKQLFVDNTTITEQDLRSLANDRANTVRTYIEAQGNIPNERVFIIAPKVVTSKLDEKEPNMGVDFALK